jgi:hypothetical protein
MEELIARLSSKMPVSPVIQSHPDGRLKVPVRAQAVMPHRTALLAGENQPKVTAAVDSAHGVTVPQKGAEPTVVSQSGLPGLMFPQENLRGQLPVLSAQNVAVQEAMLRQSRAVLPESRDVSDTHGPSGEPHKTDRVKLGDANNIATPASPDTSLPLLQILLPQSIAVIAPQPENFMAKSGLSKSSMQPANGGVAMVSKRRLDPAATLPVPMNSKAAASIAKELAKAVQEIPQPEESAIPANEHATMPAHEKSATDASARPDQSVSSIKMAQQPEGHNATPAQSDLHPLKESVKGTSTVAQPLAMEKAPVHAFPGTAGMQQQAAPNTVAPAVAAHRMQQPLEAHRVEASAAQVLQRMDTASPSSAMQLRADARHLDVGVTSGSLGWVEVRASVNPSGKVDAALHLEMNASAHVVAAQSKEIADYAREHSVQLGQISVGVGTGDGSRGSSGSMQEPARNHHTAPVRRAVKDPIDNEARSSADPLSLISIRA